MTCELEIDRAIYLVDDERKNYRRSLTMHIVGRFSRGFVLFLILAISISGLAYAQSGSHALFFPYVLSTEILYPNTARLSVGLGGVQANGWSGYPSVSADGRFVAFESGASNLVNGDSRWCTYINCADIFVHGRD